jgi:hypothetical protein
MQIMRHSTTGSLAYDLTSDSILMTGAKRWKSAVDDRSREQRLAAEHLAGSRPKFLERVSGLPGFDPLSTRRSTKEEFLIDWGEGLSAVFTTSYPLRVQALRNDIIRTVPKMPIAAGDRQLTGATHTPPDSGISHWRMQPVRVWSGGVKPREFEMAKPKLRSFLLKVEAGQDLTPHLSELVHTKGVVLPGASPAARSKDMDRVLIRAACIIFI